MSGGHSVGAHGIGGAGAGAGPSSRGRLARLLQGLPAPRVLVVGDLMLDHYVFGNVERISPEAPIPILRASREEARPGGAGSVVAMLRRLGAEVLLVAATGQDAAAEQLRAEIAGLGVDLSGLVEAPGRPTTRKTRHIAAVQHILRVDHEVTTPYPDAVDARLCALVAERMEAADIVLVSDYGKGLLLGALPDAIRERRQALGKEAILDPKKQPDWRPYRGMTAITPNRAETALATGIAPDGRARWAEAGAALCRELDVERVVMTLDREGIYLHDGRGGEHVHVPTEARAVYDVTGAGDMVIATVGLCRAAGVPWPEAVALANAAAGVEITRVGVAPLTREEVCEALVGPRSPAEKKITTLAAFCAGPLAELRRQGKRVVYTNGCYDILHVGHVRLLEFARQQGDHLVVGLNADDSVRRLKGPGRPILGERERANLLAALEVTGHVLLFEEDTPIEHIRRILPDVLVKASDYEGEGKTVVGRAVVEAAGGHIAFGPLVGGVSTTDILDRVKSLTDADRAAGLAARAAAEAAYASVEEQTDEQEG